MSRADSHSLSADSSHREPSLILALLFHRSPTGDTLLLSSSDGYCSIVVSGKPLLCPFPHVGLTDSIPVARSLTLLNWEPFTPLNNINDSFRRSFNLTRYHINLPPAISLIPLLPPSVTLIRSPFLLEWIARAQSAVSVRMRRVIMEEEEEIEK